MGFGGTAAFQIPPRCGASLGAAAHAAVQAMANNATMAALMIFIMP
jgi:hypothetical protein